MGASLGLNLNYCLEEFRLVFCHLKLACFSTEDFLFTAHEAGGNKNRK